MSLVLLNVVDRVATLTLNNPNERNLLSAQMVGEIVAAMDTIEMDPNVGAIVVTGAGSAFCAGANLSDLESANEKTLGVIYEGFLRIARSELPTIAAVNGAAVGAGMNLALGCDVRLAVKRAKFDTRFLHIGIHPGGGHTWMLRRIAGPQTAMATVVFGEVLDGEQAQRAGLVWRCVDESELMTVAQAMAARAAAVPKELLTVTKRTIAEMADVETHADAVQRELAPQVWSIDQPYFAVRVAELKAQIGKNQIGKNQIGRK